MGVMRQVIIWSSKAAAYQEAVDLANAYLTGHAEDYEVKFHYAKALYALARKKEAVELLLAVTRAVPDNAIYHCELAEMFMSLAEMPKPVRHKNAGLCIKKAMGIAPENPQVLLTRGVLLSYAEKNHEAIDAFMATSYLMPMQVSHGLIKPTRLELERREPFDSKSFATLFGCPIKFSASANKIYFSNSDLKQPFHFVLRKAARGLVGRDAVFVQPTGFGACLVDHHIMAQHRQPMGRRQTGRPGPDHSHGFPGL